MITCGMVSNTSGMLHEGKNIHINWKDKHEVIKSSMASSLRESSFRAIISFINVLSGYLMQE